MKKGGQKPSTLKKTVIAVCVLPNICIERGDLYDTDNNDSDQTTTTMEELVLKLEMILEKH